LAPEIPGAGKTRDESLRVEVGLVIPHSNFALGHDKPARLAASSLFLLKYHHNRQNGALKNIPPFGIDITLLEQPQLIITPFYRRQQHPPVARSRRRSGPRARVREYSHKKTPSEISSATIHGFVWRILVHTRP
jgi:hypothetical protein